VTIRLRRAVKRGLNRVLGLFGVRLVGIVGEEEARYQAKVDELRRAVSDLAAVYREKLFPDLKPRSRRIELLSELIGTQVPEAMYLVHHLQTALAGPGDVCEMGVAEGATAALIANEILETDRTLWLYDSFEMGLSAPTKEDVLIDDIFELGTIERYSHTMSTTQAELESRLDAVGFPRDRTRIVPGWIRRDLPEDRLPDQVAFCYIDFDFYEPTLTALELMHRRCRSGSVLMVDDYRFFSSGVEAAVNEFMGSHSGDYELLEPIAAAGHFCSLRRDV
jgi:O-methyltransferase